MTLRTCLANTVGAHYFGFVVSTLETAVLKVLFVFPVLLVASALVFAGMLPLLAFLPVLLAVGAGIFAVTLALGLLGLVLRVFAALFVGAGGLLVLALGFGFVFAGGFA